MGEFSIPTRNNISSQGIEKDSNTSPRKSQSEKRFLYPLPKDLVFLGIDILVHEFLSSKYRRPFTNKARNLFREYLLLYPNVEGSSAKLASWLINVLTIRKEACPLYMLNLHDLVVSPVHAQRK